MRASVSGSSPLATDRRTASAESEPATDRAVPRSARAGTAKMTSSSAEASAAGSEAISISGGSGMPAR